MEKITTTEAGQQYAAAHAAHYTTKDLGEAIGLYRAVIDGHPDTLEAEYSRSQIQNLVSAVVPRHELVAVHIELLLDHVAPGRSSSTRLPQETTG